MTVKKGDDNLFTINAIVWLFQVLFMLHDFEEIIVVEAWKNRYQAQRIAAKMKKPPFEDLRSTASFSIAVAIEFIVICAISLLSVLMNWYLLWYGLFFGFTVHLLVHGVLCLRFRHYVPGIVTSIPFFPICVYLLYVSSTLFPFTGMEISLFCVLGVVAMLLIVIGLHRAMGAFERLVTAFARER